MIFAFMHNDRTLIHPKIIIIYNKSAYMGALTDAQVYLASYRQAQIEKDDSVLTCMSVLSHQCQVMSELFIF